jgi:tRNA-splicing ligase RtcB
MGSDTMALRTTPAPLLIWGRPGEDIDQASIDQARRACELPISVAAALMPDAHVGYGLPIGGVLATRGAVIPYAVGVDIACRMKVTVLDLPADLLGSDAGRDRLTAAIEAETRFGMGSGFGGGRGGRGGRKREHAVMDDDWSVSPVTARVKDKAHG